MKIRAVIPMTMVLFVSAQAFGQGMGAISQTEDVAAQPDSGHGGAEDGATLVRTKNGFTGIVSMPTPVPGMYTYPPYFSTSNVCPNPTQAFDMPPAAETFTLWAFNFDDPGACSDAAGNVPPEESPVCDSDDVFADPPRGGAFNVAGHVVGGPHLHLAGHITKNDMPAAGAPLTNPLGSEIHLAVAPHGVLNPQGMPGMPAQIKTPIGCPPHWWAAIFLAP